MTTTPTTAFCPVCQVDREVTGLMGPLRFTLSRCGHVVARDSSAQAEINAAEARVRAALARAQ